MMNSLIDRNVETRPWEMAVDIPRVQAETAEARKEKALSQLPSVDRIREEREKMAKRDEELKAQEQTELAKLNKLETLNADRSNKLKRLLDSEYYLGAVEGFRDSVKATIREWFFEGRHPQLGSGAPPHLAIDTAARVYGAELIQECHGEWAKETRASVERLGVEMIQLARELGIVSKLPEDLREKAGYTAPAPEPEKSILEHQLARKRRATVSDN